MPICVQLFRFLNDFENLSVYSGFNKNMLKQLKTCIKKHKINKLCVHNEPVADQDPNAGPGSVASPRSGAGIAFSSRLGPGHTLQIGRDFVV